jgi:hypothetical protein
MSSVSDVCVFLCYLVIDQSFLKGILTKCVKALLFEVVMIYFKVLSQKFLAGIRLNHKELVG